MQTIQLSAVRTLIALAGVVALAVPAAASAQYSGPYAQLVITTQTAAGSTIAPVDVTVNADGASFNGTPTFGSNSASVFATFNNDTHLATFNGGSYNVLATQTSGYNYSYSSGCSGYLGSGNSAQCAITGYPIGSGYVGNSGTLVVYANAVNPANSYYNYPLSNFTMSVTGNAPSPTSFQGSSSGTVVTLGPGNYTVVPTTVGGFTATPGADCSGLIQNGETHYCTVTYTYAGGYPYNPYNPYYPNNTTLTCSPSYQQTALGGTVNFLAEGGTGLYSWNTGDRSYVNAGQTISATFQTSGTHAVSVTSGIQTATCSVYVLYPLGTRYGQPANGGISSSLYGYPVLPSTGFGPQDGAAIAFAFAALIAAGYVVAPYVRRTAQSILG